MRDLSLHILDIAENSITAGARRILIKIRRDTEGDRLVLEINDDGKGIDQELIEQVTDSFYTTKKDRRFGIGLALLRQAAEESDGHLTITSQKDKGTSILANFRGSHIDMKPLGDIGATIMVLIAGNPGVDFLLEYREDEHCFKFDTALVKQILQEVPINAPNILKALKEDINKGICFAASQMSIDTAESAT
ncbi:MAG: ATP-binding protein [Dissulfurispiraceae bacterium]